MAPVRPPPTLRGRARLVALTAISVLAAVLMLAALEGALRLAGYGGYGSAFRVVGTLDNGSKVVFTDHAGPTSYFFANRSLPGSLDPVAFESPKPRGTFRVLVVGESAAKGNPYPRPLSWADLFREMLESSATAGEAPASVLHPGRRVEIINLGTTAVASYPVLGLMTQGLDFEPDLVIAYLGNNEFYGAYGVASLHSAGRSPTMIRAVRALKSLAVAQFADQHLRPAPHGDPDKTLMETMVGRSFIGPNDPARAAAAHNLGTFVADMADRCRDRGAPLIVCTPPANERGLAPLGRPDLSGRHESARGEIERDLAAAVAALPNDPVAAESAARRALARAPDHATAHHVLARALLAQGRDAASEFRAALDLDPMPWRPPSASVQAIRDAVRGRAAAGTGTSAPAVTLCDLERVFRDASPGGSVGWELMDDHVHASLAGQALIARALLRTVESEPGLLRGRLRVAPGAAGAIDEPTLLARAGDNPYDRYAAAWAMAKLARVPFFRDTNPEFLARHERTTREVEAASAPPVLAALRLWQDPATHRGAGGEVRPIGGLVGHALHESGHDAQAEPLFRVAADSVTPLGSWEVEYRCMALLCRRGAKGTLDEADRTEALDAARRAGLVLKLGASKTGATEYYLGLLRQVRGEYAESIAPLEAACEKLPISKRPGPAAALADSFVRTGRPDKAAAFLDAQINAAAGDTRTANELRALRRRIPGP